MSYRINIFQGASPVTVEGVFNNPTLGELDELIARLRVIKTFLPSPKPRDPYAWVDPFSDGPKGQDETPAKPSEAKPSGGMTP